MVVKGKHMVMGRAYRGLYGLKHIQFGNNVSHAHNKTRRSWKPNVQYKAFWSEVNQRFLRFRMTTSVIKQVKKLKNGIDEYLINTPNEVRNPSGTVRARARCVCLLGEGCARMPQAKMPRNSQVLLYDKAIKIKKNMVKRLRHEHLSKGSPEGMVQLGEGKPAAAAAEVEAAARGSRPAIPS